MKNGKHLKFAKNQDFGYASRKVQDYYIAGVLTVFLCTKFKIYFSLVLQYKAYRLQAIIGEIKVKI